MKMRDDGALSAVLRALLWFVVVKQDLKLSTAPSIFQPSLLIMTYLIKEQDSRYWRLNCGFLYKGGQAQH